MHKINRALRRAGAVTFGAATVIAATAGVTPALADPSPSPTLPVNLDTHGGLDFNRVNVVLLSVLGTVIIIAAIKIGHRSHSGAKLQSAAESAGVSALSVVMAVFGMSVIVMANFGASILHMLNVG
jgi:hypothetical protein